jgi:hypothetical protein
MPKRFYLRCGDGKTARVSLQGKGGGPYAGAGCGTLAEERRGDQRHAAAYRAPLRQALIDDHSRHMNVIVCKANYNALKRGIEIFAAGGSIDSAVQPMCRAAMRQDFLDTRRETRR